MRTSPPLSPALILSMLITLGIIEPTAADDQPNQISICKSAADAKRARLVQTWLVGQVEKFGKIRRQDVASYVARMEELNSCKLYPASVLYQKGVETGVVKDDDGKFYLGQSLAYVRQDGKRGLVARPHDMLHGHSSFKELRKIGTLVAVAKGLPFAANKRDLLFFPTDPNGAKTERLANFPYAENR